MANNKLKEAKKNKNDEFYTQLADIENEMRHYKEYFKGKTVLCNCDDPRVSNFFHYFAYNFEYLGLKRLITTCYKNHNPDSFSENKNEKAVYLIYDGDKNGNKIPDPQEIGIKELQGDGDFRSEECIALLKQADVVVTNPPFSLFREYVAQLVQYDKKFIIIGDKNSITYKEIFKLVKENKIWLGYSIHSGEVNFLVSKEFYKQNPSRCKINADGQPYKGMGIRWFTNIDTSQRHEDLILYKKYTPEEYPHYDNYDAINVDKTCDIPVDYDGAMGVPITFLDKYNPEQFKIVNCNDFRKSDAVVYKESGLVKDKEGSIKGKPKYVRILIQRRRKGNGD